MPSSFVDSTSEWLESHRKMLVRNCRVQTCAHAAHVTHENPFSVFCALRGPREVIRAVELGLVFYVLSLLRRGAFVFSEMVSSNEEAWS